MLFNGLVVLVAILTLIVTVYSDALTGKKKSSKYFMAVQQPTGKQEREASLPDPDKYNRFYAKLNS